MVIEPDTHVPKGNERLKYPSTFHERRVAKATDGFEGKRLLPLSYADGSQRSHFFEIYPEVCESGTTEERKVHLHKIVHAVGQ